MQHQMSNKKCQGICQKITVNGPKHRLDDRICTDLGWLAGFVWMWQRQKEEGHQMTNKQLPAKAYAWNLKMLHNQVKPRPAHYNKEAFIEFFLCVSQHAGWTLNGIPYSGMRENELVLCCRLFPALYCHGSIRL